MKSFLKVCIVTFTSVEYQSASAPHLTIVTFQSMCVYLLFSFLSTVIFSTH